MAGMATMLKEGKKAPGLHASESSEGGDVSLKDLRGKTVVLYFYPKDDTPGCTREACAFRDTQAALKKTGAVVLGVSGDSLAAHEKFRAKYKLNFPLLSDPDKAVAKKYGAWGEKVLYGKKVTGMIRSTFVIDAEGVVRKVFPRVRVDGHAEKVLEAVNDDLLSGRRDAGLAAADFGALESDARGAAPSRWRRPCGGSCVAGSRPRGVEARSKTASSPRPSACGRSWPCSWPRCCAAIPRAVLPAACAIEMVHTASLILDDLPSHGRRADCAAAGRPATWPTARPPRSSPPSRS